MSSPNCKRQKLADDVNSVAKMSKVSPMKDVETQTENATSTASTSNKQCVIDVDAQTFEAVAKMDGFVDRTMLIEELLQGKKEGPYAMIFAPSKFGKSVNLDMIRLFCDIEDKDTKTKEDVAKDPTMEDLRSNPSKNMKVFLRQFEGTEYEECLILKRKQFVIQHFGRHPVVSFNFKGYMAKSESEAIFYCAKQVRNGYEENSYLKNSKGLNAKENYFLESYTNWCNYEDDELRSLCIMEVMDGLKNLIASLRIYWGRKPVFLVDEIDKPCVFAMESKLSKQQVFSIGTSIIYVICSFLKPTDKLFEVQAALLTGICKFVYGSLASTDNTLPVYFLSDSRFSKYYGLTAQEVDTLVKRLCSSEGDAEIKTIISDINAKYNGYYQFYSSGADKILYARYCVFSILNYIKERNEGKNNINLPFWSDGGFLTEKFVPVLRTSDEIMSAIQILFYDDDSGNIQTDYCEKEIYFHHILELYHGEVAPYSDAVFMFFLQRGYLTYNLEKPIEETTALDYKIYVRIPNLEIKELYKKMFEVYYKGLHKDILSKFTYCGEIFKSLPTQDSTQFQKSLDELCERLKCIFKFLKCRNKHTICSQICAILTIFANYEKCALKYRVNCSDDDNNTPCVVHIDVWGRHCNFATIFEVKFNSMATGEPGKIGCKTESSLAAAEDIVKLLPGKGEPEHGSGGKAGTGRDLEVLKSQQIKNYVLIGLAVDGDYTTHMLVFRDTTDWENVIQVNPENHVAELISTHLKSKISVV